jgi:glycosyltransferase involved in cell wall biosynthesis
MFHFKSRKKSNSILYLENFPIKNAGYQYRAQKWSEVLNKNGYDVDVWTLYTEKKDFNEKRKVKPFSRFLIKTLWIRFFQVWRSRKYETIIVRRELLFFNDYGNLFMEKLLLRIHPNAILDFDDDLAGAKGQPKKITNWYARLLGEHGNKFNESLRLYKRFIVASSYLKKRVLQENREFNPNNIAVIPTCVDYDKYPPKNYPDQIKKIAFGWIGGDHNYPQLRQIIPVLNKLKTNYEFKLIVIGGSRFESQAKFEVEFTPWSLETEVENLYKIDVGLMPLEENNRTKGKGGFKLIQYMGLGIASIASAVTINKEIINVKENEGFLVESHKDWMCEVEKVLKKNLEEFGIIGGNARKKIEKNYTFKANTEKYINFIKCV